MKPGTELNRTVAEEIIGYKIVRDEILGYMERLVNSQDGSSVWGVHLLQFGGQVGC